MLVQSLDQEESVEQKMATHSSILAWKIPWTEQPGKATVHGATKSQTGLQAHNHGLGLHAFLFSNKSAYENKDNFFF